MLVGMAKLMGIDVGTSGCKVLLIDEGGRVLRQAAAEYPLSTPQPLWSEQNPEDWWNGVQSCLAEIGERPDAIGVTGQMHGAVFLDANDEVIRPAILWNDQRTTAECREIDARVGEIRVREITRNPPLTGFQAPKVLWLRNREPENFARLRSVLLPKDYIRFRLTGVKATEVSDASGTGLLDVVRRQWSDEMMEALGLDRALFPECVESDVLTGATNGGAGLNEGIPVVGGGGDQAAAAVGTGAVRPGVVSVSLGTSGVVFTAIDEPNFDPGGAAHTFCHANRGWHAMGVMLACGGALRWYRDTFCPGATYDQIAAEAETVPIGAGGATFLPYLTGERCPHNDPFARAALGGLTLSHTRAHASRAVFEGISYGLRDGMELLRSLAANKEGATSPNALGDTEIRVTGGGAKSRFWLQMLADMFGAPCVTLVTDEGPAFGAAILAGVGSGIWRDAVEACAQTVRASAMVTPSTPGYEAGYARYRNLYSCIRSWNHDIAS
jgi:xylulokinase